MADGSIRTFLENNFLHYNARETLRAAKAYEAHVDAGGKMMVTLAGAMSTAQLGKTLAPMIRAGKVQCDHLHRRESGRGYFQFVCGAGI